MPFLENKPRIPAKATDRPVAAMHKRAIEDHVTDAPAPKVPRAALTLDALHSDVLRLIIERIPPELRWPLRMVCGRFHGNPTIKAMTGRSADDWKGKVGRAIGRGGYTSLYKFLWPGDRAYECDHPNCLQPWRACIVSANANGKSEILQLMPKGGPLFEHPYAAWRTGAVHMAIRNGHVDCLRELHRNGNFRGGFADFYYVTHLPVAKFLLEEVGREKEFPERLFATEFTVTRSPIEVIEYLTNNGVVELLTTELLKLAFRHKRYDVAELFVRFGVSPGKTLINCHPLFVDNPELRKLAKANAARVAAEDELATDPDEPKPTCPFARRGLRCPFANHGCGKGT